MKEWRGYAGGQHRNRQVKTCAVCGRQMAWRRAWARNWERMRYCSAACRRRPGTGRLDHELEGAMERLLRARSHDATICPSEAARAVRPEGWRQIMRRSQAATRRLQARGIIEVLQKGRPVDPSTARGPIRLQLADPPATREP